MDCWWLGQNLKLAKPSSMINRRVHAKLSMLSHTFTPPLHIHYYLFPADLVPLLRFNRFNLFFQTVMERSAAKPQPPPCCPPPPPPPHHICPPHHISPLLGWNPSSCRRTSWTSSAKSAPQTAATVSTATPAPCCPSSASPAVSSCCAD